MIDDCSLCSALIAAAAPDPDELGRLLAEARSWSKQKAAADREAATADDATNR